MLKTCSEVALTRLNLHGSTMGTRWAVTCDSAPDLDHVGLEAALQATVDLVDAQMSPWKPDSNLMRLNRAEVGCWVALFPDMLEVLKRALEINRLSDGAFDPCVGDLVDAWGFGPVRGEPDAAAIRATRQRRRNPCLQQLELDVSAGCARKLVPAQIDLCGIAKGYAVDRMVAVLQQHGVRHALVALDGELRALGTQANDQPWSVALESPQVGRRAVHGVIEMAGLAVATSGDYRRYVLVGDAHLAHSMDGRRAGPVNNGMASVTVLASTCMDADAWATALLVAGPDEGAILAKRYSLEALMLLRRENGLVEVGFGRFQHS
ncbi:FAD:protein FMN transferase [Pseudomonas sp. AA-38]|uniref:FAD:protein FMN transferase n=1 Tax=Pseudomonas sp. AA-38 TaxID=3028807 RepID=UPI0023F720B9|nr:FAD:protein FMN transferase [Pseudomonas sp. AA-38]